MGTVDTDTGNTSNRPEGSTAQPLLPISAAPFPFPTPFSVRSAALSLSASIVTDSASNDYPYEEMVELHETLHTLATQLTAATTQLGEWQHRAEASEARALEMADELSTLRLMCGDEQQVKQWQAEQQRRARVEMRQWRLIQEQHFSQLVVERDDAAIERRQQDEQREAQRTTDLTRNISRSLTLVHELTSLWQSAVGASGVPDRRMDASAAPLPELSSSLHSALTSLHQNVLDNRARRMLEPSTGQCVMQ